MPEHAIVVENLSKSYLLGHKSEGRGKYSYVTLRDVVGREVRNFARKAADLVHGRQIIQGDEIEEFWALRDVSFAVRPGEVVGIIGRNGAGKSTLLKILSRITDPTKGRISLRGRVASMLEVGTGFHPELTGRENVFLNGAILGMTKREILRKFDEIVVFADVEKFIDTPVKRYSSGMYVRLAFAVAAHLEPEILIIDEVLAVGDAEFQKRCLGKLHDLASDQGRTVLFVSHNLSAIRELTTRAILLNSGQLELDADVNRAISTYLAIGARTAAYQRDPKRASASPHISRAEVLTSDKNGVQHFGRPLEVRVCIEHVKPLTKGCFSFQIVNQYQQPVIHAFAYYPDVNFGKSGTETVLACRFPELRLNVGNFYIRTFLSEPPGGETYEVIDAICHFEVVRTDKTSLWGWRPDVCTYHELCEWTIEPRLAQGYFNNGPK